LSNTLRPIKVTENYLKYPEGSCLYQAGHTKVLCTASLTQEIPTHAKLSGKGWLTAEYSMLPRATHDRSQRSKTASGGRTKEIQRLIGRSLRSVIDLERIPEIGVFLDCDVLQADGGTRTASINGSFIALIKALRKWRKDGKLSTWPVKDYVGAVSVGIVDGKPVLDLDYEKDVRADVDMNIVMTGSGRFVEVQGTAEHTPFNQKELQQLLHLANRGIRKIIANQKRLLGDVRS
jgi:ribonuclease PH